MSLIPAFKLGLWNSWIFILPIVILSIFGSKVISYREQEGKKIFTKKEKKLFHIYMIIIVASYAYSVFLPFKLGTAWFYIGLFIFLLAMFIEIMAILSFAITPVDKPVTKGVYRISRNPMYIGEI